MCDLPSCQSRRIPNPRSNPVTLVSDWTVRRRRERKVLYDSVFRSRQVATYERGRVCKGTFTHLSDPRVRHSASSEIQTNDESLDSFDWIDRERFRRGFLHA